MKFRLRLMQVFKAGLVLLFIAGAMTSFYGLKRGEPMFFWVIGLLAASVCLVGISSLIYVWLGWKYAGMLGRAGELAGKGDFKFAISAYEELQQEAEDGWLVANEVYGKLGLIYRETKRREKALDALEKQRPFIGSEFARVLVDIYLEINDWQKAEAFYRGFLEKNPAEAYFGLARINSYARKTDETLECLKQAFENGFAKRAMLADKKFDYLREDEQFKQFASV